MVGVPNSTARNSVKRVFFKYSTTEYRKMSPVVARNQRVKVSNIENSNSVSNIKSYDSRGIARGMFMDTEVFE